VDVADGEIDYMRGVALAYAVNGDGYLGLYATHRRVLSADSRHGLWPSTTLTRCFASNGVALFLDICVGVEEAGVILQVPF
jgi:hypothetical protein